MLLMNGVHLISRHPISKRLVALLRPIAEAYYENERTNELTLYPLSEINELCDDISVWLILHLKS